MYKKIVHIKGMHCRSCELQIEDELSKISSVCSIKVDYRKGVAEAYFEGDVDDRDIIKAVRDAGYYLGFDEKPFFSHKAKDYLELGKAAVILGFIFTIAWAFGLFKLSAATGANYSSLPMVLLIGLTAGISTCMALVGGLVLGASARFSEKHPNATSLQKFKPHLFFNLGRIISFFVFGALIGYAGSFFQISPRMLGFLTIVVGIVMLLLGMQLVEIFPKISKFSFTLPSGLSKLLGIKSHNEKEYSHKNSLILGGLTFFLPCGFTQAMQLFAISTGNPLAGALTMGVFAIGTAPGLLGIGGLTSIIKGNTAKLFFRTVGLAVILLAFFNISNGYNLSGLSIPLPKIGAFAASNKIDLNVTIENGEQIVKMRQVSNGYKPNSFTVKKGVPVKWIITSEDSASCAATIASSALGIRTGLTEGENEFKFTPQKTGEIRFSCIMGMYTGKFKVVDDQGNGSSQNITSEGALISQSPSPSPSSTEAKGEVQLIKAVYSDRDDIQPTEFKVKKGLPVRFDVEATDNGSGCMGTIAVPKLSKKVELLTKDKTTTFEFTPENTGKYYITCAMGVARGVINVI